MYKAKDNVQFSFDDFNQPLGMKMNPNNRWILLANLIPWDEYESKYADLFKSKTGTVAKPFRMALGALIIQKKLGFSDRELVEQITENPYLQYFIGLPGYQEDPPFDPSSLVHFRKRINLDVAVFLNDSVLKQTKDAEQKDDNHDDKHDHHDGSSGSQGGGSSDETTVTAASENQGTLILDATCAPSNIRYPQDYSLLNEAREKLEEIIRRICRDNKESMPRTYCKEARQNYLNLAKSKKRTAKRIRAVIRKQLGYVNRDLGYIGKYLEKAYKLLPKEDRLLQTIRTLYEQQKTMHDNKTHRIPNRIVSIEQPYLRPIVRGKVKAPVEFGVKFDLSVDESGYGRIEKISFDPYNEAKSLIDAIEAYRKREGHYPERVLADQIYRNRENRKFCKEHGIRISGPKLGRPNANEDPAQKKIEYQDNTDRIEVERSFSLSKRCYGLGLIRTKLEETTLGAIGLSIFVTNLFKLLDRKVSLFFAFIKELLLGFWGAQNEQQIYFRNAEIWLVI